MEVEISEKAPKTKKVKAKAEKVELQMLSPWDQPDFEWDHKLPEWIIAAESVVPEGYGVGYDNQTLFSVVKSRSGREALRSALTRNQLKIEQPVFLDSCESALLQHQNYQTVYRRRETIESRREKAAAAKAEKLAKRTAEREAASEIKRAALYEKEVARQEKARLREAKVAQAAVRRIQAQLTKAEKGRQVGGRVKKRKISQTVAITTDSDESSSSSSSSAEDDDDSDMAAPALVRTGAACNYGSSWVPNVD